MEWQLQGPSRKSSLTETPFQDEDEIRTFLSFSKDGQLERWDVLPSEVPMILEEKNIVGQWVWTFRSQPDKRQENKERKKNLEELFMALYIREASSEQTDQDLTVEALKQILALALERKKILLRLKTDGKKALYRHRESDQHFEVDLSPIAPQRLLQVSDRLSVLL